MLFRGLRDASLANEISLETIEQQLGAGVVQVVHDCQRLRDLPERLRTQSSDDNTNLLLCDDKHAEKMRTFLLTFHDQRAIVVELASRLDILRNNREIFKSKVRLQQFALETMKIYAPLASALHTGQLSAELEDAAFRALFPKSYRSLDEWLNRTKEEDERTLEKAKQVLIEKMSKDRILMRMVLKEDTYEELLKVQANNVAEKSRGSATTNDKKSSNVTNNNNISVTLHAALNSVLTISARRKSRFSSMKKILRDGRKRANLRDVLGIRVVINPQSGSIADVDSRSSDATCYRAQQIAHAMFAPVKGRTKDYIAKPKKNGYQSLHSALIVSTHFDGDEEKKKESSSSSSSSSSYDNTKSSNKEKRTIELQIRTRRMHSLAEIGNAAHSAYKGGFTEGDPGAAETLKDLVNAANVAAVEKFGDFTDDSLQYNDPDVDALFRTFDADKSGSVSVEELKRTIETVWLNEDTTNSSVGGFTSADASLTAETLMKMLDVDADGKISPEEFKKFREFATTFKACSNADEKQSERIRKAVEMGIDKMDVVEVEEIVEAVEVNDVDDAPPPIDVEINSIDGTTFPSKVRRQERESQKIKDENEIDVDRLVKEVISASGSFDETKSSLVDLSDDEDVVAAEKEISKKKIDAIDEASSIRVNGDEIEKKKKEEDEDIVVQPPNPDQVISQSYVLISDSDASSRKAREALKDPLGGVVEWQLIWDLQRSGRAETARQLFYQRTTRTPSDVQLWEQWARFELLQGDQERSRGLYKTALLHSEGDAAVRGASLRKWATMEFGAKNFEESTSLFKRCVSVYDDEICGPSANPSFASSCDYPPKGEIMRNLVKGRLMALHAWAKGEFRRGNVEEARRILKLCADHVNEEDNESIAKELSSQENVDSSSEILEDVKILRASPHVAHLYAQLEEAEGQLKPALRKYRFAAKLFPNDAYILQSLAEALARRGHVVNSRKAFKEAIGKFPNNHVLATSYAIAESKLYKTKGKETVARSEFARAASLAPWSVQAWYAWGQFEYAKSHIDAAKRLFERAIEAELGNSRALIGLAKCYDKMELFDECRETLELAMLSNPDSWGVFHESAKLYEKRGNVAKASHLYNKAKALGMKSSVNNKGISSEKKNKKAKIKNKNKRGTWAPDERNKTEEQAQIAVDRIRAMRYRRRSGSSGSVKRDPVVKFFDERTETNGGVFSANGSSDDDYFLETTTFPNAYKENLDTEVF